MRELGAHLSLGTGESRIDSIKLSHFINHYVKAFTRVDHKPLALLNTNFTKQR